jgi:hypothetical protein
MRTILMEVPVEPGHPALTVEVDQADVSSDLVMASDDTEKSTARAAKSLDESLHTIVPALRSALRHLREIGPDGIVVEFGLKFGGEYGLILAKGTAEVNLKVTVTWASENAGS